MKKVMENNYPGSRATCAEMVPGDDGKGALPQTLASGDVPACSGDDS